jgi:pimeloyl-ACP methyl ester carboxylesterase
LRYRAIVNISEVSFDSGGQRCAATLYWPDSAPGPLACVVMGHGVTLTRRDGLPDYATRLADSGFAVLAFDYRHWGNSEGQPRSWVSIRRQLQDWRAAVACARQLEGVEPGRIVLWGMSLGGAHALTTAASDADVAAVIAVAPLTDGLAFMLMPTPPAMIARIMLRATREAISRRPCPMPIAGAPGEFAALDAPEALSGFERLTAGGDWSNQFNPSQLFLTGFYRPVRHAASITMPALLQLAEHDAVVPLPAIEKTAARAPKAELLRYPTDHFGCFWPEHLDQVAADQLRFLERHLGS